MKRHAFIISFILLINLNSIRCDDGITDIHTENTTSSQSDGGANGEDKPPLEIPPQADNQTNPLFEGQIVMEGTSQNSGVINEIADGGEPIAVTLIDNVAVELEQRAFLSNTDDHVGDTLPTANTTMREDIPSFSEWAQKRLEEAERSRENGPGNTSSNGLNVTVPVSLASGGVGPGGGPGKPAKFRWKNYASPDCGAKVVAANPEAESVSAVLSSSRDEYILNPCTSRVWFVVELCEAIQAKRIDFANFELFASSPKDFAVYVGDRFPTRDWLTVGQFQALDERNVQTFELHPQIFGKYVKIEVKSHYGAEHYCPISMLRVYGTSEFEVLQKEDSEHGERMNNDDDDEDDELDVVLEDGERKNLFSSATDAVISIVKKAAEVLGNKGNHSNQTVNPMQVDTMMERISPIASYCITPNRLIVCDHCNESLFEQIYELLSCKTRTITELIRISSVDRALKSSEICKKYGLDLRDDTDAVSYPGSVIRAFFSDSFLGAMCNAYAVSHNRIGLNSTTDHYMNNTPINTDFVKSITDVDTQSNNLPQINLRPENNTEELLELPETTTKSSCSTDTSYVHQIKATPVVDLREKTVGFDEENVGNIPHTLPESAEASVSSSEDLEHDTDASSADEAESVETDETFLSDFPESTVSTLNVATPHIQEKSVFLRLSNRIKVLERNMSLSGQYLEELSKRYKRQVDEMQRLFERTIAGLVEENRRRDERARELEGRLMTLALLVENLIAERKSWLSITFYTIFLSVIILIVYSFYTKKAVDVPVRRKSLDVVVRTLPTTKKKRRPSDQALKIVRCSTLAEEKREKRKKKKKLSKEEIVTIADWVVENTDKPEIPIMLEESEHSTLEPLATPSVTTASTAIGGAPDYVQTATNSRLARVSSQNGVASKMNGDSSSGDDTKKTITGLVINGNTQTNGFHQEQTPKKERKGLRKIFKKVF